MSQDKNSPASNTLTTRDAGAGAGAQSNTSTSGLAKRNTVSVSGLHARLRNPIQNAPGAADPNTMPNRIALLLDVSGSMAGKKIMSLRDACTSFVEACNLADTSVALEPFGLDETARFARMSLTSFAPLLTTTIQMLQAAGGTPMADALRYALGLYSLTRAVLVSDGQPDSEAAAYAVASEYHEAGLICDCVHIGTDVGGEQCLRRIAEMTGGQYIKFTDIQSFARSFKYLTPTYYGVLTSGGVTASQLGAKEIK